jgi:hypothetical protein
MLYKDFIELKMSENKKIAQEIYNKNKKVHSMTGSDVKAYESIVTSLKMILKLKDFDIRKNIITDGNLDGAIDALYCDDKNKYIHIFDVKFTNSFARNDIINIFSNEFLRNFLNKKTNLKPLNKLACQNITSARDKYFIKKYKVKIYFVRLDFYGDCVKEFEKHKVHLDKNFSKYSNLLLEPIGLNELIDKYFSRERKEFFEKLDFDDDNVFYDKNNDVAIGRINISKIVEMINKSEKLGKSYNIFDDNVRIDQENKTLDNDLLQTLKNNKERFYLFHNGITVSCSNLETTDSKEFELYNPQILNGCQSMKSLQRIYNDTSNKKFIDGSLILCRVFKGKDNNDVNSVCQSTNSQRPIDKWDLRTNDLIQKILENLLVKKGYSYNRKIIRKKGFGKIVITDLAQWISSCIVKEPAEAKSSKKNLFDISNGDKSNYFTKIYNNKYRIDDLVKVCSTCIFVKETLSKIKKKESDKDKKSFLDHANFHIMAYVYNYGTKDEKSVRIAISKCEKAAIKSRSVNRSEYSYNNIFKNKNTWSYLK